ncbi:MAG: hypothetical protein HUJ80_01310 [Firmicutes bacterium]|nr:hypothetical protein [Bacillota bacterium]
MKRKFYSIALSICVFISSVSTMQAADRRNIVGNGTSLDDEIVEVTKCVLQFMEPEKDLYSMGNVNFSSLYLGAQIPAYVVKSTGLVAETDILYYPIMSGSEWIATAIVTADSRGHLNVQISTDYAKCYEESVLTEIAFVFDDTSAYVVTEQDTIMVATAPNPMPERGSIQNYSGRINLNRTELIAKYAVGGGCINSTRSFDNQYYLQVPCIQQAANSLQCWAACIASIRGYYGTTTTIDDVYTKAGVTKYLGANIYTASNTLESYGFTVTNRWAGSYNWYQLRTAIYSNETPVYAGCSYTQTSGHAVVIRGFYVYQNISQVGIISYMDPVTGTYVASSVATDGEFYYVPSGGDAQYTMSSFLEVAE